MKQKKPLLNNKIAFLMWIPILVFWFIPKDIIPYYAIVLLPILFTLFLDAYNPLEENRNPFLWKLRIRIWGEPK